MAEYHFPVPGSVDEHKIVLFARRHWASFIGQFFLSGFMLVLPAAILVALYFSQRVIFQGLILNFLVLGLSIYYLIAITVTFIAWITFYYDVYIVCHDELIDITQQGFFGRKISQLSMLRVQDVSSEIKGLLPTLFAYGDVLVETAGEQSQNFLIKAIPHPQEVASKIMALHEEMVSKEERRGELLEAEGVLKPGQISQETSQAPTPGEPAKTSYQELLNKDKAIKEENKAVESQQGEVSKEDLEKGGKINL